MGGNMAAKAAVVAVPNMPGSDKIDWESVHLVVGGVGMVSDLKYTSLDIDLGTLDCRAYLVVGSCLVAQEIVAYFELDS
jgi:hypothetical protein